MEHYKVKQASQTKCIGKIFTVEEEITEIHFLEESKCNTIIKYSNLKRNFGTVRINNETDYVIGQLIE